MKQDSRKREEIACPHCDAIYYLQGKNDHPVPVVCRQCGRMMYDGRRKLKPGKC
jgi:hypothetical protein